MHQQPATLEANNTALATLASIIACQPAAAAAAALVAALEYLDNGAGVRSPLLHQSWPGSVGGGLRPAGQVRSASSIGPRSAGGYERSNFWPRDGPLVVVGSRDEAVEGAISGGQPSLRTYI